MNFPKQRGSMSAQKLGWVVEALQLIEESKPSIDLTSMEDEIRRDEE